MAEPLSVQVTVLNLPQVQGDIAAMEQRARDFRPAFRLFDRRSAEPFLRRQFETAGAHGGTRWRPLAASTVRSRERNNRSGNRGGVGRPLWDSGELKASLDSGGGFALRSFQPREYARGTRLPRGAFHQAGTRHIPARVIIPDPWPGFLQRQWDRTADRWLTLGLGD